MEAVGMYALEKVKGCWKLMACHGTRGIHILNDVHLNYGAGLCFILPNTKYRMDKVWQIKITQFELTFLLTALRLATELRLMMYKIPLEKSQLKHTILINIYLYMMFEFIKSWTYWVLVLIKGRLYHIEIWNQSSVQKALCKQKQHGVQIEVKLKLKSFLKKIIYIFPSHPPEGGGGTCDVLIFSPVCSI